MDTKGFGRVDRDAWFTPRDTSYKIVNYLLEEYPEWSDLDWVEPSAGDGSFIDACEAKGVSVIGYDLEPRRDDVIQADFLDFNSNLFSDFIDLRGKIVIGNPPYGFRNKLAIDFINKSFSLGAEKVAFLLLSGMLNAIYLSKIDRKIDLVKVIDTDFIDGEGEGRVLGGIGSSMILIVFDKELDGRAWDDLENGPYCRGIKHDDTIEKGYIIAGHNQFGLVDDFIDGIELYRDFNMYKFGGKIYRLYEFYDKGLIDCDREFLENLYRRSVTMGHRPTSSTVNYWLMPENRVKVDWEAL